MALYADSEGNRREFPPQTPTVYDEPVYGYRIDSEPVVAYRRWWRLGLTLVIEDHTFLGQPCGFRVGWKCGEEADSHVIWWGSTRDEASLQAMLADPELDRFAPIALEDRRNKQQAKPFST